MAEVDTDHSGTVDFFEFLSVARLITQQQGIIVNCKTACGNVIKI